LDYYADALVVEVCHYDWMGISNWIRSDEGW
jgi:hypothetical protein